MAFTRERESAVLSELFFASQQRNAATFDQTKHMLAEQQRASRLLNEQGWREAHGYEFTWADSPSSTTTVRGSYYQTAEECRAAKMKALEEFGYKPPRWWQYWRWGEVEP